MPDVLLKLKRYWEKAEGNAAQEEFDTSLFDAGSPSAETSYGGGGQLPTATSVETLRAQNAKALEENAEAVDAYKVNQLYNGTDYAAQYLANSGGMSGEQMKQSPVVNQENAVVKRTEDENANVPSDNAQFLKEQGLDTDGERLKEWMRSAPEYVSEEEQARRLRAAKSAQMVSDLGSVASAFANLYYTGKDAPSQTVAMSKGVDYNGLVDKWQAQRNNYRTYAMKGAEYVRQRKLEDLKNAYESEKRQLDNAYRLAQTAALTEKSTREQQQLYMRMQQLQNQQENADRNYELAVQKANNQAAYQSSMLGLRAAAIGNTAKHYAAMEGRNGGKGGKDKAYTIGGHVYQMPNGYDKENMEKAILDNMIRKGVINPAEEVNGVVTGMKKGYQLKEEMRQKFDPVRDGGIITGDYRGTYNGRSAGYDDKKDVDASQVRGMGIPGVGGQTVPREQKAIYKASDGTRFETHEEMLEHERKIAERQKGASGSGGSATRRTTQGSGNKGTSGNAVTSGSKGTSGNKGTSGSGSKGSNGSTGVWGNTINRKKKK